MTVPSIRQAKGSWSSSDPRAARRRTAAAGHRQPLRATHVRSGLKKFRHRAGARRRFLIGTIPNNYRLVREAIDRGVPLEEVKPGNNITAQLKKLMLPQIAKTAAP